MLVTKKLVKGALATSLVYVFPCIMLASNNISTMDSRDFIFFIAFSILSLSMGLIVYFLSFIFFRNYSKSLLLSCLIAVLFFSFGHVIQLLFKNESIYKYAYLYEYGLYFLYLFLFMLGVKAIKKSNFNFNVAFMFVLLTFGLPLIFSSHKIIPYGYNFAVNFIDSKYRQKEYNSNSQQVTKNNNTEMPLHYNSTKSANKKSDKPDIYYFILDEYARKDTLKEFLEFDNSNIISYFKSNNFYIADKSKSNYAFTYLSVPSTLKMNYINDDIQELKSVYNVRSRMRDLARNPESIIHLKKLGYDYFQILSSVPSLTDRTSVKGTVYEYKPFGLKYVLSEFYKFFIETTLLRNFAPSTVKQRLFMLDSVEKVIKIKQESPKLVFMHILLPHGPYVFNEDGSESYFAKYQTFSKSNNNTADFIKNGYVSQLQYLNNRLVDIINLILSNKDKSKPDPIIVMHGDHGTDYTKYIQKGKKIDMTWELPRERMSILNVFHGPENFKKLLYPNITPVNNFRAILKYLGESVSYLEDKSYYSKYKPETENFNFIEVD